MRAYIKQQLSVLTVGLAATVGIWLILTQLETRLIQSKLDNKLILFSEVLSKQVEIEKTALYALELLYKNSDSVSLTEFTEASKDLLSYYPHLQALEWVPIIRKEQREGFVTKMRVYYPDYDIINIEEGVPSHSTEKEYYFPVSYLYPYVGNELALGFDLGSNESRLQTLLEARNKNRTLATDPIHLVQNGVGYLLLTPIYDREPLTVKARQRQLKGYVIAVFKVNPLLNSTMTLGDIEGIHLSVHDVTDHKSPVLLYSNHTDVNIVHTEYNGVVLLDDTMPGRVWRIEAYPSAGYLAVNHSKTPSAIVALCIAIIGALLLYLHLLTTSRALLKRADDFKALSNKDALTGLPNRMHFDNEFKLRWEREKTLGIIAIDIDYFKQYNDTYGHLAGDDCLRSVAALLREVCRKNNVFIARIGGEEFSIILKNPEMMESIMQALCTGISGLDIQNEGSPSYSNVTISLGGASCKTKSKVSRYDLLESADKALYSAKGAGRNRYVISDKQ